MGNRRSVGGLLPFGMKDAAQPNLSALDPGDELYKGMPPHVRETYRRAKAFRRQAQRRAFVERAPVGLESPDALVDYLR